MGMLDSIKTIFTLKSGRSTPPPIGNIDVTNDFIKEETQKNIDHLERRLEALKLIRERV